MAHSIQTFTTVDETNNKIETIRWNDEKKTTNRSTLVDCGRLTNYFLLLRNNNTSNKTYKNEFGAFHGSSIHSQWLIFCMPFQFCILCCLVILWIYWRKKKMIRSIDPITMKLQVYILFWISDEWWMIEWINE